MRGGSLAKLRSGQLTAIGAVSAADSWKRGRVTKEGGKGRPLKKAAAAGGVRIGAARDPSVSSNPSPPLSISSSSLSGGLAVKYEKEIAAQKTWITRAIGSCDTLQGCHDFMAQEAGKVLGLKTEIDLVKAKKLEEAGEMRKVAEHKMKIKILGAY